MSQYENYCRYDAGIDAWSILFRNKPGHPKEKIDQIFSKFGPIKRIIQTGDAFGYCIVKFTSQDDAINCITAEPVARDFLMLKTFFAEKRPKPFNNTPDNSTTNYSSYESDHSSRKSDKMNSWKQIDTSAPNNLNKNSLNIHTIETNSSNYVINSMNGSIDQSIDSKNGKMNGSIDQSNDDSKNGKINGSMNGSIDQSIDSKTGEINNSKYEVPSRISNFNLKSILDENAGKFESRSIHKNGMNSENNYSSLKMNSLSPNGSVYRTNSVNDGSSQKLSSLSLNGSILSKELPELIERKSTISGNSSISGNSCNKFCCGRRGFPEFHEVIVANIDNSCDESFILKLFQEYEPSSVSSMKIHEMNFRYCYVYFKSREAAAEVERSFDRLRVYGRGLIVLRTENLAAHV